MELGGTHAYTLPWPGHGPQWRRVDRLRERVVGRLHHAWIQDVMVARASRRQGVGARLVQLSRDEAKKAKCEWLHVDFDDELGPFYYDACGFEPAKAGLIHLA